MVGCGAGGYCTAAVAQMQEQQKQLKLVSLAYYRASEQKQPRAVKLRYGCRSVLGVGAEGGFRQWATAIVKRDVNLGTV